MTVLFKQFGMRRTSTNVLAETVQAAFGIPVDSHDYGHKHRPYNAKAVRAAGAKRVMLLIAIKNPYAWVVSLHRWLKNKKQVAGPPADDVEWPPKRVISQCVRYNRMYKHWCNLPLEKTVVPFEELIADPQAAMNRIADELDLEMQRLAELPRRVVAPIGQQGARRELNKKFDKQYYDKRRYLQHLTDEQRQAIADTIDWKFFKRFGYHPEDAS